MKQHFKKHFEIKLKTYMNCTLWVEEMVSTPLHSNSASPLLTRGRWTNSSFSLYSSTVSSGSWVWTDKKGLMEAVRHWKVMSRTLDKRSVRSKVRQ